ncbi:MAG: glycosyltransferase family 4 protein [Acidobacteriota bacterium]|nr:glycosyltransferase family 4 protein [Acidobacteriota bacterium]
MHVVLEPRYSGAEMLVRNLAQHQMQSGHRVSITALRPVQQSFAGEMQKLEQQGCRMLIPKSALDGLRRAMWLYRSVKAIEPDIVFAHSALPSVYARLALRFTRRPVVVTVLHSDDDFNEPRMRRMERLLRSRHAQVVGVNSKSVENYRLRVTDRVSTQVIMNGVHADRFSQLAARSGEWRQKLYAPEPGEVIALQVGRISFQKQQHVSVEALIRLKAQGISNLRLVLAGPIDEQRYFNKLMTRIREGKVARQVQVMGARGDIAELLAGADMYLMPSDGEAHSIAALEALASGAYCVFSGIPAFAGFRGLPGVSMIGDPPTAEDLASCLEDALANGQWRRRYERNLGDLTFERCAAEYNRLIQRLLCLPA